MKSYSEMETAFLDEVLTAMCELLPTMKGAARRDLFRSILGVSNELQSRRG